MARAADPAPPATPGSPGLPSDALTALHATARSRRLARLRLPLPRPTRSDWILVGVVLSIEVASIIGEEVQDEADFTPLVLPLLAAVVGSLLWRRRHPVAVLAIVSLSAILWAIFDPIGDGVLPLLVGLYSVAVWEPNRRHAVGAAVGVAAIVVVVMVVQVALDDLELLGLVLFSLVFVGAWMVGWVVRIRRELAGERTARREETLREESRAAAAAERVRIARELHDVVAHSVGVMTVQAGAARMTARGNPAAATDVIAAIEESGREAMQELRRIVTVLRAHPDAATQSPLTPQPGLADLGELKSRLEGAGVGVAVEVEGTARVLPPAVDLTAYRIVQEALTNVLKHAGPATATVRVRYTEATVELEIADNGQARPGDPIPERGHGLVGMRERASLFGGTVEAGPHPQGGFQVRAVLPAPPGDAGLEERR